MFPNYQQYALNEQQRINKQVAHALVKKYSQENLNTGDMSQEAVILYYQLERKMSILVSLLLEAMSHITDNPNYSYQYHQDSLQERKSKRRRKIDEDQIDEDQIDEDRLTLRSGRRLLKGSGYTKYNHDNVFVGTLQSIDTTLVDIQQIVNQLSQSFNSLERGQVIRIDNILMKTDERFENLLTIFSKAYSKKDINSSYKEDLIQGILDKFNSINGNLSNMIDNYSPISNLDD